MKDSVHQFLLIRPFYEENEASHQTLLFVDAVSKEVIGTETTHVFPAQGIRWNLSTTYKFYPGSLKENTASVLHPETARGTFYFRDGVTADVVLSDIIPKHYSKQEKKEIMKERDAWEIEQGFVEPKKKK